MARRTRLRIGMMTRMKTTKPRWWFGHFVYFVLPFISGPIRSPTFCNLNWCLMDLLLSKTLVVALRYCFFAFFCFAGALLFSLLFYLVLGVCMEDCLPALVLSDSTCST